MAATAAPASMLQLRVRDYSGGLNLRDAPIELSINESPDNWNVTLDERGGVAKRLGYSKWNPTSYQAALVQNLFYWESNQSLVTQCGAKLYLDTSTTAFHTFTTDARCGIADFNGVLCFIHPIDGFHTYDGATVTAIAAGPNGSTLSAWQTRLFAAGDPADPSRVWFSALGDISDATGWPSSNWVDLKEKDGEMVLALAVGGGLDNLGRPGLLAFKRNSTYRIYDSANGAFQTLDAVIGAASPLAVSEVSGRTVVLSLHGIYWTDGVSAMRPASTQLETLWNDLEIAYDQPELFCAGRKGQRVRFSLPRQGSTANDLALEYHPEQGWIVAGSNAASCYATYGLDSEKLLFGSPTVDGQVYESDVGGTDDGADIASYFQTRWFEPSQGILTRMRRLRLYGRGLFTMYVKKDYGTGTGSVQDIDLTTDAGMWNNGESWGQELWGPTNLVAIDDLYSLGTAKAVSFRIEETSSLTRTRQHPLGRSGSVQAGAWALYGVDLLYVQLGIA